MRVLAVMLLALGCKGDPVKCEQACRNYAQLVYWKKADAEIAAAPADQRDDLRKQKLAKFTADLEAGVDLCTSKCISASNDTQTKCLIEAKTSDQAVDCTKE
ncbi:MAG TPA: hypothetical protein VMJ10_34860 [Kofleriaceae bacterium]|nr:hypothetical protein [Kofleriaceae bacterium]